MTKTQLKKIESLRRTIRSKEEFLVRISKLIEMDIFLNKEERARAVTYIRKEILKELIWTDLKKQVREQLSQAVGNE